MAVGVEAYEIVQMRRSEDGFVSIRADCSACDYVAFTGAPEKIAGAREGWILDHLSQHKPGRALDIAVDWEVSASCSVCEHGGDVQVNDSESLICHDCGTTWTMDGRGGEKGDV